MPHHARPSGDIAILGGSAEARDLAQKLGARARLWLPARDRVTGEPPHPADTLEAWLSGSRAVISAPHPCDTETLRRGPAVAGALGLPHLTLLRPAWRPGPQDHWVSLRHASEAARYIPAGSRVLVTLGRPVLPEMSAFREAHAFVRQLTPHAEPFPLRHGRYLFGNAPFTVASEIAVLRRFRIDAVLTRNAGGTGGWPKVAAARALGLPVYMVARERVWSGPVVPDVDAAMHWCRRSGWLDG